MTDKKCAKCKAILPTSSFNKNRSKPDGLGTECRICANAHSKNYHIENHAAHLERGKAAYIANPEAFKVRARKWEFENPERKRELRAAYRAKFPEKCKAHNLADWLKHGDKRRAKKAEYRTANPERGLEHVRARQTRLTKQMPSWADRDAILAVYIEARRLTRETGIKHHVDHFYPLKGRLVSGLHVHQNLQAIPALDNQRKANHEPSNL